VLNYATRHENVWGSGGITPTTLNLDTKWTWVVSFTPRPLYPRERVQGVNWTGDWVGPRAMDMMAKRKITCPRRKSNPGSPARRLVTVLTELRIVSDEME